MSSGGETKKSAFANWKKLKQLGLLQKKPQRRQLSKPKLIKSTKLKRKANGYRRLS